VNCETCCGMELTCLHHKLQHIVCSPTGTAAPTQCASGLTYSRSSWSVHRQERSRRGNDDEVAGHSRRVCFSTSAYAQDAPPKVGNKPLAQIKPKEPMGCKLVGTVKGTRPWAGDCVASELRGTAPAMEAPSLNERANDAIPPGQR
jgi:hypothetical protein